MFANDMQKYLGKPFQEGAAGPDAYDCVGFVYRYLNDSGHNIPDSFKDFNADNYFLLTKDDKEAEAKYLREWLLTLGREISVKQVLAGDLLLSEAKGIIFLSVYAGNGHAISVARHMGVRVHKVDHKHIKPLIAIRCDNG
jgi:hypothetical protein